MVTVEREAWVVYLEGDVVGKETVAGYRVYQVVLRIQGSGLLAIVKARGGGGYYVRFLGAGTLPSLTAKIRNSIIKDDEKWKKDRYPPI